MPDVRIVAVADAYKSRREAAAARLNQQYGGSGIVKAHADFREILARARRGRGHRRRPRQLAYADVACRGPGRQGRLLPETTGAGFRPDRRPAEGGAARRSGSSSSERSTVPWEDTGRWCNSCATATSANSSGSTCGAATCRTTWANMPSSPTDRLRKCPCPPISTSTPGRGLRPWSRTRSIAQPAGADTIARRPRWASLPGAASTSWGSPNGATRAIIPARSATRGPAACPSRASSARWNAGT